jgi:hypothetical protein
MVIIPLMVVFCTCSMLAQQNNMLFFMHSLPEANFLNPAVQARCPVFIGLPLVSSLHLNAASSGFTAGRAIDFVGNGDIARDPGFDPRITNPNNYLLTEVHAVLFAAGLRKGSYYYTFSVMEKNNASLLYTRDLAVFSME